MNDESRRLMIKGRQALLARGDADFSASRADYAMFYAAEALLNEEGLSSTVSLLAHCSESSHFLRCNEQINSYPIGSLCRLQNDVSVSCIPNE